MKDKIVIINHESICEKNNEFYCDNIDSKSIPEGLSKDYEVTMIARKSKIKRSHKINLTKINVASNILVFLFDTFKTFKNNNKYLLISITPYTFLAYLILFFFKKKIFVYLRSDGYKEYKFFFPIFGPFIYHIMFSVISWKANLISCRNHLLNGKLGKIVSPSQLNKKWFSSRQKVNLANPQLLYIGRIKIEKGIFSLVEIFKNLKIDAKLSIVAAGKIDEKNKINQKNINLIEFENKNDSIIKIYDSHNIFILPSFTEAHPQVLDESLSRLRPVIIFEEISHVVGGRKGIFISKRDPVSLLEVINHIMNNYHSIEKEMMQNSLPTKEIFLKQMSNIIREN